MSPVSRWKKLIGILVSSALVCKCSAQKMAKAATDCTVEESPLRLKDVKGFEERRNDVIYYRKDFSSSLQSRVVYFGGDVQDYPEVMLSHRDNKRFEQWNLLNTAVILGHHFPSSEIYVIKPVRMQLKTFSCYDNFIIASNVGAPDHVSDNNAIQHLKRLLEGAAVLIKTQYAGRENAPNKEEICTNSSIPKEPCLLVQPQNRVPIVMIGFSKGCVVLNQFLYELHLRETNTEVNDFMSRVSDMYWLDGGHAGGSNTWVTKKEILQRLANTGIRIHVCMTPFQLNDERRPWLRKEERIFSTTLSKMDAKIQRTVLFGDQPGDINLHFQILKLFKTQ